MQESEYRMIDRSAECDNVFVDSFAYALGELKIHVRDSAASGQLISKAEDLESAGFRWHWVCEPATGVYDLAKAVMAQLAESGRLGTVDAIIYSTCLPWNGNIGDPEAWAQTKDVKHLMDFPASHLQADFALRDAVVVGLTQQGCTGMLGSIRLAAAMLAAEAGWNRILCVTADRFPETAKYEQSYNLVSDCAAACIVSRESRGFRFVGAHQITNGGLVQAENDQTAGTFFSYTYRLLKEAASRTKIDIDDLDWIITQNTHEKAWKILAQILGVAHEKICHPSLPDNGHAISADNIVNLISLVDSGRVLPGHHLALVIAGSGLNYQCVILQAPEAVGS
jgi:3-oxoacyl-[acyl-carrier-protein] synthase-3